MCPKKLALFQEIGRVKICYRPHIVECVSEYILLISKNKQTSKKTRTQKK